MTPQYDKLPQCVRGPIERYVEHGLDPGRGLTMVLRHDLWAVLAVDDETLKVLPDLIRWLHNEAPSLCHGNTERVVNWEIRGGRWGCAEEEAA